MKSMLFFITSMLFICTANAQLTPTPAIVAGDLVFVTAQFPIDKDTGRLVNGSIEELTKLTIKNMKAILKNKGAKLNQVIKTTICLSDMRDLSAMNFAYTQMFDTATPPTQEIMESVNLPFGSRIQISCIADKSR